jgi:EmrB/QacA subfamily drug resistance transporter
MSTESVTQPHRLAIGGRFSKRGTLALVCIATAMLMLDIAVVNTALPRIAHDLHAGLSGVQWVIDAYTLTLASVILSAGSLSDRFGRRLVFAAGMAVFTAASLLCGLANSMAVLDVSRAIQGIGAAMLFASSLAILADAFPAAAERNKAFAIYGATIGASFALGPLLGGALTSGLSWQAVFFVNLPLGAFALATTFLWVRESRDPAPRGIDWPGQAALAGGLFLLVLALLRGNDVGWGSVQIIAELGGAAVLLVSFVLIERRAREPMLPLHLLRIPAFAGAQLSVFAMSASFFALFLYTTLYLQEILHLSPIDAGLAYLPGTILLFVVSGATAEMLKRTTAGVLIVAGLVLVASGLALMTITYVNSSWLALLPGLLVVCAGTGLFNPALAGVALGSLPDHQSGLAAGVNDAFRQGGIAVGVAAYGVLVPARAALGHGSSASYVSGMHEALWIGAVVAVVGAIASAKLIGAWAPAHDPEQALVSDPVLELT